MFRKIFGPHICGDALDIQSQSSSTTSRQILTGSWRKDKTLQIWDYGSGKLVKDVPSDYNGSMVSSVNKGFIIWLPGKYQVSFPAKTSYPHTWRDHRCYGYIINCRFDSKLIWYFTGVYIINRIFTYSLMDMNFIFSCSTRYLTSEISSWPLKDKIHIIAGM